MPRKKSPAQLDHEIAAALHARRDQARTKSAGRAHAKIKYPNRARSTVKAPTSNADPKQEKQEDLLMIANDAALSGQYDRAEKILGQSKPRTIATAFTTITAESAAAGDYASKGWEDKEGDEIEVDAGDIENEVDEGSQVPVTDAIVDKAVQWLRDHGATSTSSTRFHRPVWYETEFLMDYSSGEEKQEEFFLRNFTEQEEKRIFDAFNKR